MPEEKEDAMEEDVEDAAGTRETPIEVVAEVVAPREVPNPVEVRQKPRVEERTTRTLPTPRDEVMTALGQWAGGPPKDKRRVVVDEGLARRREDEKGNDESKTVVERSVEVVSAAGHQAEGTEGQAVPTFEDMEEPMVEIAVWTTAREEALNKVMDEARTDEGEVPMKALDENRQRYKDMLANVAAKDATEEIIGRPEGLGSLTDG